MKTTTPQPGLLARMGLAFNVFRRGGIADVVQHIRRVAASRGESIGDDEAYNKIVAVHVCVQKIARNIASMPFCVSTADERIIESGPIADLLDHPNAKMSIEGFFFETAGWELLTGRVHWLFDDGAYRSGRPKSITPVGAGQMRPITDGPSGSKRGNIVAWLYREPGQRWDQGRRVELDAVWTIRNPGFDPDRPYEGLSPVDVVRRAIAQVYKADIANEASLDNGVEPGGALIHKGGMLTDPQRDSLRDELTERHAGPRNRRRPLMLMGEWDWKQISSSFSDMEFSNLKLISRGEICAAFDLPHAALFEPSNGSSSEYVDKAIEMIWTDATIPRAIRLAAEFDRGVLSKFEGDPSIRMARSIRNACPLKHRAMMVTRAARSRQGRLYAWFDASAIDAMKKLMASRIETATKMVEGLYETPAHAGALMDLGLSDNPAQQMVWQRTTAMPFDADVPVAGADDPAGPGTGDEDDATIEPAAKTRSAAEDQQREADERQLAQIYQAWRSSWKAIEDAMAKKVARHFNELRGPVIERVMALADQLGPGQGTGERHAHTLSWVEWDAHDMPREVERSFTIGDMKRDLIGEILFDLVEANGKLIAYARPLLRTGLQLGGDQAAKEHADATDTDPEAFSIQDPEVAASLRRREIAITGSNRTLRRRLAKELAEGIEAQETAAQIADRVRREFNLASGRATTIARTEVGRAVEEGRDHGRRQAGVPLKSWLWSRKETGRPWHMDTERDTLDNPVPNDEDFVVAQTGNTCPHPRATNDPEDDINCGCTTIARYPGDSIRAALGRYTKQGFVVATRKQIEAQQEHTS